jgi:hypothetical protein
MADLGTVPQLVKDAAAARTFKFQVLDAKPLLVVQLTVAEVFPATVPRSGSVAVKLIVPGVAVTALIVVLAIGRILFAGTTTRGFGWAESICIVPPVRTRKDISLDQKFMWR